jgi:4'-phosphopantetheinyl transferase
MAVTADTVHVWLIRSDLPLSIINGLAELLDEQERERAALLVHDSQRRRYTAAHGAARVLLGRYLRVPPQRIRWSYGPEGKPELAAPATDVHVNLSHSGELAALAVTHHRRIGIDVQQFPPGMDPARMAARFYPAAEARFVTAASPGEQVSRFIRLWARKEACLKVTGGRLMQGMRLPVRGSGSVVVRDPRGQLPGTVLVRDVPAPAGFRAAVALEDTRPFRVLRHTWPPPNAR